MRRIVEDGLSKAAATLKYYGNVHAVRGIYLAIADGGNNINCCRVAATGVEPSSGGQFKRDENQKLFFTDTTLCPDGRNARAPDLFAMRHRSRQLCFDLPR